MPKLPSTKKTPLVRRKGSIFRSFAKWSAIGIGVMLVCWLGYTMISKTVRCNKNRESYLLTAKKCDETMQGSESPTVKAKSMKDMNCDLNYQKSKRNCAWHGL